MTQTRIHPATGQILSRTVRHQTVRAGSLARTIEVPAFSLDETRLLLTDPLKHSPLFANAGERPRLAAELWGPGGIERIHAEAGGWPHLLQLIAETLVDLLNEGG